MNFITWLFDNAFLQSQGELVLFFVFVLLLLLLFCLSMGFWYRHVPRVLIVRVAASKKGSHFQLQRLQLD